ncbi:MAG: UDP-forming cellulose synthase catalytic subunit [Mariprofundaceae bacterium]
MGRLCRKYFPLLMWLPGAVLLLYIADIDLYPDEQMMLGALSIVLMLGLRWHLRRSHENKTSPLRMSRLVLMVIGGFIAIRYLFWRVEYSLPWQGDTASIVCAIILVLAEAMAVALYFLGAFVNIHPLRREVKAVNLSRRDLPGVDVFIPTFDEAPELLRTTLLAATNMHYSREKLNVYLLDDGGTDEKCQAAGKAGEQARARQSKLKALCHEVGCQYLTRARNEQAKAGNINAALAHTHGDLVAVLDADHVPTADFLEYSVVPLLEDEKVALVQTPHFMLNRDPIERNLKADRLMPGEGEMFYTLNLRGMDNWNAGFFCGSGAILRRKALEEIGGIGTRTIVEDAETSIELSSRGYKSAYLHRPMLSGLNAESTDAFVTQRTRWGTGMVQLLSLKNPLTYPGLNFAQRLSYFNCIFFWLFSIARVVFLLAPIVALLTGITLFDATPTEILLYLAPHLIAVIVLTNVLYGRVRWIFVSEVYETLQSLFLVGSVLKTLILPRNKKFNVTPKGEALSEDFLSAHATRFYWIIALQLSATAFGIYTMMTFPEGFDTAFISLLWNAYNMLFVLGALGILYERRQLRTRPRVFIGEVSQIQIGSNTIPCLIQDMTEDGALIRLPSWLGELKQREGVLQFSRVGGRRGDLTTILKGISAVDFRILSQRQVREDHQDYLLIGVALSFEDMHQRRAAVKYVYGDSERWRLQLKERNSQSTIWQGVAFMLRAAGFGLAHLLALPKFLLFRRRPVVATEEK